MTMRTREVSEPINDRKFMTQNKRTMQCQQPAAANAVASFLSRFGIACHAVMGTDLIRNIYVSDLIENQLFFPQQNLMEKNLTTKLKLKAFIWLRI